MTSLRSFRHDCSGASAAEFALVLPALLILLLGTIDVGRWMWNVGQLEKATMMGTRYAVVTDWVAEDFADYSFAVSGSVPQGNVVPENMFPGIVCSAPNGTVACSCPQGETCNYPIGDNQDAFDRIVARMNFLYRGIGPENVIISYSWSGLGFSGNPNGADVDPIVTISLRDMPFRPITFASLRNLGLPGTSHALTMEDGVGERGN